MTQRGDCGPSITMLAVLLCGLLQGQEALTFEQALERARTSPSYQARVLGLEAWEGEIVQAGRRPNPELQAEFALGPDDHTLSLLLVQKWERGGKRGLRRRVAEAGREQSRLEVQEYGAALDAAVADAYFTVAGIQEQGALLEAHRKELEDLLAYDQARLEEGEIPVLNLQLLQVEMRRVEVLHEELNTEYELARHRLNTYMGADLESEYVLQPPPAPGALAPLEQFTARAMQKHPGLRALRSSVDRSRAKMALEQARASQDWEIGLGYFRYYSEMEADVFRPAGVITSATDAANLVGVRLTIPLPVWDDNSGNMAAAVAGNRAAQKELAALERRVRAEIAGAYRRCRLQQRKQQLQGSEYQARLADNSRREEAAYRLAGGDIQHLINRLQERLEGQLARSRAALEFHRARIDLERASGGSNAG